jgi:hypothetical protein
MNIAQILTRKYPGTLWALIGDDYSGLEWLDESPKPTEAELEAWAEEVHYEVAVEAVEKKRQAQFALPVSQGGSDGLFFRAQRGKGTVAEWQARVAEIEAMFPYPEKPKGK